MAHRPCNFPVVGFSIEAMDGTAPTSRYLSSTTGNTTLPPAKVLTNAHSCSPTMRKSHVTVHLDGAIRCSGLATLSDLRPLHASSTRPPSFLPLLTEHGLLRQNRVPFPRAPLAHHKRLLRTDERLLRTDERLLRTDERLLRTDERPRVSLRTPRAPRKDRNGLPLLHDHDERLLRTTIRTPHAIRDFTSFTTDAH
jgi:hypothetical protein